MKSTHDGTLLERAWAGDSGALEKLYAETRDRIFTVLRRWGADESTADDLLHEVYLRIWNRPGKPPAVLSGIGYLCATARNLWHNACKHEGVLRRVLGEYREVRGPVPAVPTADLDREDIDRALRSLGEGPRETFVLHRFAGLSYREISEVQSISVKAVEARMKRAFEDLRAELRPRLELGRKH